MKLFWQRVSACWEHLLLRHGMLVKVPAPAVTMPVAPDPLPLIAPMPAPSNERVNDAGRLRVDDAGRVVHWPEPPAPDRRTARCAYEDVIKIHCDGGVLKDALGTDRGWCAVCAGTGEVRLQ